MIRTAQGVQNVPQREPIIIGCHHKTGTNILSALLKAIGARHWLPHQLARGRSEDRKLPLSEILASYPKANFAYFDVWFEHEVDVPPDSIRFLHFVRHPAKWVRSAYLYDRNGGPSERIGWLEWRVFRNGGHLMMHQFIQEILDEA